MANRFWTGGSGTWDSSTTTNWATTTGGAGGASAPTASDTAIFDSLSNTTAYTVTMGAGAVCLACNFSAAPAVSGTITWAGSTALTISGQLTLLSGMTRTYTGAITFNATSGTQVITSNSVVLNSALTFNGVGGTWQLADTLNIGSNAITLTKGTFDTNGKTVTALGIVSTGASTRVLTLGASSITLSDPNTPVNFVSTGFTFNCNTSSITCSGAGVTFAGGGLTFNNVTFTGNTSTLSTVVTGTNTFANLTITGASAKNQQVGFNANQTITSTLNITGQSLINRVFVYSVTSGGLWNIGTAITLTAAIVSLSNVDFADVTAAGVAAPFTGSSLGNAGGNTSITTTTPVTRYKISGGNTYSSTATWSTSSGGSSGASVPLCHDTIVFDSSSFSAAQTITIDLQLIPALDFTNATNTPGVTFNVSSYNTCFFLMGGLNLTSIGTLTFTSSSAPVFAGRSAYSITTNGKSFTSTNRFWAFGATGTLNDNFTGTGSCIFDAGTLDLNGKTLTTNSFSSTASINKARTLTFGGGSIVTTGTANAWNSTNLTITASPVGTIKFTDTTNTAITFAGGGLTYPNLYFSRGASTGTLTITGTNTFTDIKDDGTGTHSIVFPNVTTTTTTFNVNGTSGHLISLTRTGGAGTMTLSAASGTISCDYLSISNSTATGGASWYAGANSTNGGGNTGWIFTAPPATGTGSSNFLMMGI